MRKKKKKHPLRVIAVLLVIALLAVAGVTIYKQHEYDAGESYYESLRDVTTEAAP